MIVANDLDGPQTAARDAINIRAAFVFHAPGAESRHARGTVNDLLSLNIRLLLQNYPQPTRLANRRQEYFDKH
jgi:hypothetical protein